MMKKKRLVILGSTGNIGCQVMEIVDKYPNKFKIVAISAEGNIEILKKQAKKYNPEFIGVANPQKAEELKKIISQKIYSGKDANAKLASIKNYDILVNSVVGLAGIEATLEAVRRKKTVALANKETLVSAGEIVMREARKNKVSLIPIDSEHSAILQCLNGEKRKDVKKIIITCSGGALKNKSLKELKNATLEEALGHKTWAMGKKITIDSATLMNKGFEVIEAMWLYDVPVEKIQVVIHPQSLIHSMVEYSDSSIMAQISDPDMRLPIQYALSFPERWEAPIKSFDFSKNITFEKPDLKRFPCLGLALRAAKEMGTLPAAMNAANDFMVKKFLSGECRYQDIGKVIKKVMDGHKNKPRPKLEDIKKVIEKSTQEAEVFLKRLGKK